MHKLIGLVTQDYTVVESSSSESSCSDDDDEEEIEDNLDEDVVKVINTSGSTTLGQWEEHTSVSTIEYNNYINLKIFL